jgi:serine protease Do
MNGVDLARFQFDYDTTWTAFFLDADLNVYSRYGGRDENVADSRMSSESLRQTMREVLDIHERRNKSGDPASQVDFQPLPSTTTTPEDIPLLKANHQGCVHCHQVREYRLLQAFRDRTFDRSMLFHDPLPENIGLVFDRIHGHRVEKLLPESAAARAGIRPGDVVVRVNDVPVHSEQDVRWALDRSGDRQPIEISVTRADSPNHLAPRKVWIPPDALPPGWRQTELGWRKSLRSVPLPLGFLGYALGQEERKQAGLAHEQLAIRAVSIRGAGFAENVGLSKGDTIVALEGRSAPRSLEDFKSDLLRNYMPGDVVRLTVLRDGRKVSLEGRFPEWHTTDTSVP